MLDKRLPVPAYEHCLKLSHTFNVLDARGAVGVTERANCFAAMRKLCKEVTALWEARREELGHPIGVVEASAPPKSQAPDASALPTVCVRLAGGGGPGVQQEERTGLRSRPPILAFGSSCLTLNVPHTERTPQQAHANTPNARQCAPARTQSPADFVLEVGTEELPPDEVDSCVAQLTARVPELLSRLRLGHGGVEVHGTPRRLAVLVSGLEPRQEASSGRLRGPPAKAAFKDGAPTKALEGFCRKNGVEAGDVTVGVACAWGRVVWRSVGVRQDGVEAGDVAVGVACAWGRVVWRSVGVRKDGVEAGSVAVGVEVVGCSEECGGTPSQT
eukprot:366569-Chlamydomonas_euryale.AAC.41